MSNNFPTLKTPSTSPLLLRYKPITSSSSFSQGLVHSCITCHPSRFSEEIANTTHLSPALHSAPSQDQCAKYHPICQVAWKTLWSELLNNNANNRGTSQVFPPYNNGNNNATSSNTIQIDMPFSLGVTRGPGPVLFEQSGYIQPLTTQEPLQFIDQPYATKKEAVECKIVSLPTPSSSPTNSSKLLKIPLEIRLKIYEYVLEANPVSHSHLAPHSTTDLHHSIYSNDQTRLQIHDKLRAATLPLGLSLPCPSPPQTSRRFGSAPAHRRLCKIPTGLLASCRQIYSEASFLPFEYATIVFVNWFGSGVHAAREFTRALRPWQSDALRFVSLEVLGRNLSSGSGDAGGCREWIELCGLWCNVRGMRLVLKGSGCRKFPTWGGSGYDRLEGERRGVLDVRADWVRGLRGMNGLRWLSVEIEDAGIEAGVKRGFCRELEECLNQHRQQYGVEKEGGGGSVRVEFVER